MSTQPPQSPPPGGYDPNQTTPIGGGYGATPPAGGGYGATPPPAGGGYGAPPPPGGPGYYGAPPAQPAGTSVMAIISLVLGVLSILACCIPFAGGWGNVILGIGAIVLYFMAQNQLKAGMGGRGLAIAGLITGILGLVLGILAIVLVLFLPSMLESIPGYEGIIATLTAEPLNP